MKSQSSPIYTFEDMQEVKKIQAKRELQVFIGGLVSGGFIVGLLVWVATLVWISNLIS